jgi:CRISPR/Cas system CMR-associated protein Cmr5 small subunit
MSLQRVDVRLAGRAAAALDTIRRDAQGTAPAEVISQLKRLPALLQSSGVPATMAFLYSKSGDQSPLERAYRTIKDALLAELAEAWLWTDKPGALEFFDRLGDADQVDSAALSRASVRLQEFATWLRRLAEALEHSDTAAGSGRSRSSTGGRHD